MRKTNSRLKNWTTEGITQTRAVNLLVETQQKKH